jgi:hypothetical protein
MGGWVGSRGRAGESMSLTRFVLLGALVTLYLAAHFATLTTSRLPWFDDTFFSSVADSLVRTGELRLRASPLWLDKPVYLYGPVYFVALGALFDQFGIGIVQTRVLGLLCGFGIVIVGYLILRHARVPTPLALLTCAALALDPTFHQNIHAGRMDSMAMWFILLAFYLMQEAGDRRGRAAVPWTFASATCAALAVLTTPRPGYLLVPMGLLLLWRWMRRRDGESAVSMVVWGGVCALLVASWIAYAFGTIPAMLEYYAGFSQDYASGGFGIRGLHAPLLVPLGVLLVAALVVRPRALGHDVVFFTLAGIAGFYLFVKDKGTFGGLYSFFMVPLAYLAVGYLLARVSEALGSARARRRLQVGVLGVLFAFNGAIFAARAALEFVQRASRSPASVDATVARLIPPGSRVVGDDKFYFAVRRAGSDFQYLQRGGTVDERAGYHRKPYDFQYLVTAEGDTSDLLRAYKREVPLVQIATISAPPDGALARTILAVARRAGIGSSLTASYDGRVFARAPGSVTTP